MALLEGFGQVLGEGDAVLWVADGVPVVSAVAESDVQFYLLLGRSFLRFAGLEPGGRSVDRGVGEHAVVALGLIVPFLASTWSDQTG